MRIFLSAVILSTTCMFCFAQEKPTTPTTASTTSTLPTVTTLTTEAGAATIAPVQKDLFLANRIPLNSKVFIAPFKSEDASKPIDGFETYMTAALRKKGVPIIVVTDRTLADFEINGSEIAALVKMVDVSLTIDGSSGDFRGTASLTVTNLVTGVVAYNNALQPPISNKSLRSATEELAKYLKRKIVDDEKKFVNLYPGPHHAPRDMSNPPGL